MSGLSTRLPSLHFGPGERWAWTGALTYALISVLLRATATHIDPWLASLVRILPIFAVASVMLVHHGSPELRPGGPRFIGWAAISGLLLGGALSYFIGNGFYFLALVDGGLAITTNAVLGGMVWGGVILGFVTLRERPRSQQIGGAALIAAGLTFIALSQLGNPSSVWYRGLFLALIAGVSYAMQNIFTRMVQRRQPALFAVLVCAAVGGLVPLLAVVLVRAVVDPAGMLTGLRACDVIVVLMAGCLNVVARTAVAQAVRYSSVATASSIGSAQVAFSVIASVVIFGEAVPPLMVLGVIGVVGGVLLGQAVGATVRKAPAEAAEE